MEGAAPLSNGDVQVISSLGTQVEVLRQNVSTLSAQFTESRTATNVRINELTAAMQSGFDRQAAAIQSLRDMMAQAGKPNWQLWLAGSALLLGLGTAAVAFISIEAQITVGPVKSDVTALQALATAQGGELTKIEDHLGDHDKALQVNDGRDSRSEQDRADISRRLDKLTDTVSANSNDIRGVTESLKEVETQFRGDEQIAQARDQYQQRWNGIFYRKIFGEDMPALGATAPGLARDHGG